MRWISACVLPMRVRTARPGRKGRRVEVYAGAGRQQVRRPVARNGDDGRGRRDIDERSRCAGEFGGEAGGDPSVVRKRRDKAPFVGAEADQQHPLAVLPGLARLQRQAGSQSRLDGSGESPVVGRAAQREALPRRPLAQQDAARPAGARTEVEPGKRAARDIGRIIGHGGASLRGPKTWATPPPPPWRDRSPARRDRPSGRSGPARSRPARARGRGRASGCSRRR